ncbi:TPA: UTP--glucose-1-phosphate uridylyltransferase, partial [Candidatus Saccharibacteria bacterium]|nr:UTP--glucose-1-phosphate uridylyltransferase [Candidatus Saccharibacteria bacterium]
YEIKGGTFYDTGDKLEYLKTTIDFGLKHPELGSQLETYLKNRLG